MKLTADDVARMWHMGYRLKAEYRNARGMHFTMFFHERIQAERFNRMAKEDGSEVLGMIEVDGKAFSDVMKLKKGGVA